MPHPAAPIKGLPVHIRRHAHVRRPSRRPCQAGRAVVPVQVQQKGARGAEDVGSRLPLPSPRVPPGEPSYARQLPVHPRRQCRVRQRQRARKQEVGAAREHPKCSTARGSPLPRPQRWPFHRITTMTRVPAGVARHTTFGQRAEGEHPRPPAGAPRRQGKAMLGGPKPEDDVADSPARRSR